MRKLNTLVLLALLAAPALSLAANGPAGAESDVIWIAVGNQPVAVEVAPAEDMVTICYYGVTMTVREKIARRYLRIGATCGACDEQEGPGVPSVAPDQVCGDGPIIWNLAPKSTSAEKAVKIGGSVK